MEIIEQNQRYQLVRQNPFLNNLIIERLFGFFGIQELKAGRLVCQVWNETIGPILKETSSVNLEIRRLPKFLFSNALSISKNFRLTGWKFDEEVIPLSSQYLFFDRFGSGIQEITFGNCVFPNVNVLYRVLDMIPKVKVVTFGETYVLKQPFVEGESQVQIVPATRPPSYLNVTALEVTFGSNNLSIGTWAYMFQCFPKITVLNAQCRTPTDLTDCLQSIIHAKLQIKDFSSFLTEFNETQLNLLISSNIEFENLDINLSPAVSHYQLELLLKHSGTSMKTLKLFHGPRPGFPSGFPYEAPMRNLKALELIGDMIPSLHFLQLLPKLESLTILQHDDSDEANATTIIHSTAPDLNPNYKLRALSMEYVLTGDCVRRLGTQLAPNLARLSAHLDDESIRYVFSDLRNLEELSVLGTEVTDEGITGIRMSDLLQEHKEMETYREFPYIGNCTRLRKVCLYAQPQENISDYSVYYGFLDILELTSLDIPNTTISNTGVLELQLKPNMVKVSSKYFVDVLDGSVILRQEEFQQLGI